MFQWHPEFKIGFAYTCTLLYSIWWVCACTYLHSSPSGWSVLALICTLLHLLSLCLYLFALFSSWWVCACSQLHFPPSGESVLALFCSLLQLVCMCLLLAAVFSIWCVCSCTYLNSTPSDESVLVLVYLQPYPFFRLTLNGWRLASYRQRSSSVFSSWPPAEAAKGHNQQLASIKGC